MQALPDPLSAKARLVRGMSIERSGATKRIDSRIGSVAYPIPAVTGVPASIRLRGGSGQRADGVDATLSWFPG